MMLAALELQAPDGELLFLQRQPRRSLGKVWETKPDDDGRKRRRNPFQHKKPSPARQAAGLVHMPDAVGNGTTECSGKSRTRDDHGDPDAPLVMPVPKSQIICQPRKEAGLSHAQQPADGRELVKVLARPETNREDTPRKHEEGDPSRRAELLQQQVGRDLEEAVRDEENEERDDELVLGHVQLVLHVVVGRAVELPRVSYVCAVKEAEQVRDRGQGNDSEILSPDERSLFFRSWGACPHSRGNLLGVQAVSWPRFEVPLRVLKFKLTFSNF